VFAKVSDFNSMTGFPFVLFLEGMSHDHFSGCSNVPLVDLLDSAFTSLEECNFLHLTPGVASSVFVILVLNMLVQINRAFGKVGTVVKLCHLISHKQQIL